VIEHHGAPASLVPASHRYCAYLVSFYAPSHPFWSSISSITTCASLSAHTAQITETTQTPQVMPYSLNLPNQQQASEQRNPIPVPIRTVRKHVQSPFPTRSLPLEVKHRPNRTEANANAKRMRSESKPSGGEAKRARGGLVDEQYLIQYSYSSRLASDCVGVDSRRDGCADAAMKCE
jgi:hypothetical protein